jgi:hypothetical protein
MGTSWSMPFIVLQASGPSKGSIVEGAYDFCGLSGDQYERTPEELSKGLRSLNSLMASLKTFKGIDLGYDVPAYGDGLLEEPSGIPDEASEAVKALLAQRLAPTIGGTLSDDCKAVLSHATNDLLAYYAPAPVSRTPATRMRTLNRLRRIFPCLCPSTTTTPTPVPTPVVTPPPSTGGTTPQPPVLVTAPAITGTPTSGQVLTVDNGSWTNSPTSFAYGWLRNGSFIPSATANTYTLTDTDVGTTISCVVSATNADGTATANSNSVGPIGSLAPVNTALPVISGTTQDGSTLSTTDGSWTNSPTSFVYQWNRNGTAIGGATSNTYALVTADVGTTITCTVQAVNAHGVGSATATGVGPVLPQAPSNVVAPVISGTATQGQTLTVTNTGTWTNSPTSFAYQWKRNGTAITGANSSTYLLDTLDVGDNVTCTVSATNAGGTGTATSNVIGPVIAAGTLSAPTLGFPVPLAANPTSVTIKIPADYQAGNDAIKLRVSPNQNMGGATILRYPATAGTYLSDADVASGTISIGLSGLTLSGIEYLDSFGEHLGLDSQFISNQVAWGDTTPPVITNTAVPGSPGQIIETTKLWRPLTYTDVGGSGVPPVLSDGTLSGWGIQGGPDQLQVEIAVVGGVPGYRWIGDGTQLITSPLDQGSDNLYDFTVFAIDRSGNKVTKALQEQVVQADTSPTAFSFTDASGVTAGSTNTSNTITIAGLGSGIAAPATVTGGLYSKNGGSFVAAGSFTLVNGDTIALQGTASSTAGGVVNITLSVGEASPGSGLVSDTYTITTIGVSNQLDTTINNVSSGGTYTYSNVNKTAKNTNGVANKLALSVTSYSTGKRYFEATIDASSSGCAVGVGDASANTANFTGADAHSAGYLGAGTEWYNNAIQSASFATYTTGDRIAVALDVDNKKVWFAKFVSGSPVWQGTGANPSTGAGGLSLSNASTGTTFRALIAPNAINNQITLCASAADQLASPPTGFSTWA